MKLHEMYFSFVCADGQDSYGAQLNFIVWKSWAAGIHLETAIYAFHSGFVGMTANDDIWSLFVLRHYFV